MSNTKIVIDKEQILDIIKSQSINHANMLFQIKKIISEATEIQIDQSIEDAAKEYSETNYFGLEEHDEGGYLGINEKEFANKLIDFATSQQIIEQLRVKEKELDLLTNFTEFLIKDGYLNKSGTLSISNYYQRFLEYNLTK